MIYHLISVSDWAIAQQVGQVSPPSLQLEGFIHCSSGDQLLESARLHFSREKKLAVLALAPEKFGNSLVWEPSRKGAMFPHIYSPISVSQVAGVRFLVRNAKGEWKFDPNH